MAERRGDLLSLVVGVLALLGAALGLLSQADAVVVDGAVLLAGVVLAAGTVGLSRALLVLRR